MQEGLGYERLEGLRHGTLADAANAVQDHDPSGLLRTTSHAA
jgi:hypothetical protein